MFGLADGGAANTKGICKKTPLYAMVVPMRYLRQIFIIVWLVFAIPPLVRADQRRDYLQSLTERAHHLGLADEPAWKALLHCSGNWISSGCASQVDDPRFFFSSHGKTNPSAELDATLAAFFSDQPLPNDTETAACRFAARYSWLDSRLQFDQVLLPPPDCTRLQQWLTDIDPIGISLIYPAAYLNNPASSFGHSFLRIDGRGQDEKTRLLAYTASYAAATDDAPGIWYAIQGIFGLYPGYFSISPYYIQVRMYSDLESRDIWEYRLNFTAAETTFILKHIWELGPFYSRYFFFDENCSYELLWLYQAARPEIRATDLFPLSAIPVDTVRVAVESTPLLEQAVYRPSLSTTLRSWTKALDSEGQRRARRLARGEIDPSAPQFTALTLHEQGAELDAAIDFLKYLLAKEAIGKEEGEARLFALTKQRSAVPLQGSAVRVDVPPVRPDQGHHTGRLDFGVGVRNSQAFGEFGYRPAYHDLLDPQQGFPEGAQLKFLSARLRYYEERSARLEEFTPLSIQSLAARDEFLRPLSWQFSAGVERLYLGEGHEPLAPVSKGGVGGAWVGDGGALSYLLATGEADQSSHLSQDYAAGFGPAAGMIYDVSDRWRIGLEAYVRRFIFGDNDTRRTLRLEQRFTIERDTAVRFSLETTHQHGHEDSELLFSINRFFR